MNDLTNYELFIDGFMCGSCIYSRSEAKTAPAFAKGKNSMMAKGEFMNGMTVQQQEAPNTGDAPPPGLLL